MVILTEGMRTADNHIHHISGQLKLVVSKLLLAICPRTLTENRQSNQIGNSLPVSYRHLWKSRTVNHQGQEVRGRNINRFVTKKNPSRNAVGMAKSVVEKGAALCTVVVSICFLPICPSP